MTIGLAGQGNSGDALGTGGTGFVALENIMIYEDAQIVTA